MKKRSLTHRLENSQLTQMALFPIKLMTILLSMVILFVSLPLSAMSIPNGNGMTDGGESGNSSGNEKPSVALPFFDIPEVVPLSDLEERSISVRMRDEEQSLCDIVFANDDGSRTSFLYGTPVKYISIDGTVRDKSFYIADLTAEPENGYVGRMEAELAASVRSALFSSLEGKITEEDVRYATLDNDVHTLYGITSDQGVLVGRNECFIRMIPSGETGDVSLANSYSISDGEEKERVSYPNVFGEGTLIQYNPTLHGIKEDIVLLEPTDQNVFSFLVETSGVTLIEENGTIQFWSEQTGNTVGKFSEILAFDSKGDISRGCIAVEETEEDNNYWITISIDPEYLQEAEYPVCIDPTVNLYPDGFDYVYGAYTFIEDVSIYDDEDAEGYTFIEYHQIGEVCSTGYYGQAAFRFPALYDTTQPNGYSNLTPEQIGSFKLKLKSTYGTDSVNVLRASTYVPTWPNTFKIFGSAYYNHFNITSNDETYNNVPLNNTFDLDLTNMARHWKNIQYGLENSNYGTPESGVLLWNYGNIGNIWLESVEYSSSIFAILDYDVGYSSAYLNNKETGKFLGYFDEVLEIISGRIQYIGDEIDWKIEYKGMVGNTGNRIFTIRDNNGLEQYLSCNDSYNLQLDDSPKNWNITVAPGGGYYIRLYDDQSKYLGIENNSLVLSSSLTDSQKCWRIVSSSDYVDRELSSSTLFHKCDLMIGHSNPLKYRKMASNALWGELEDFSFSGYDSSVISINANGVVTPISVGTTEVICRHKVTDRSFTVSVQVRATSTAKGSLSYWYDVERYFVGNWENAPKIYVEKLNSESSFYFLNGCSEARQAWNSALDINMIETSQESTANIKAYGGSSAELAALGYNLDSTTLGQTWLNYSYVGYYTYGSSVRLAAKMDSAVVCIKYVSSKTTDEDRNTCVHEFGHALGFFGHTSSSSTVMYPFGHSGYELQTSEKNHLKQVYD